MAQYRHILQKLLQLLCIVTPMSYLCLLICCSNKLNEFQVETVFIGILILIKIFNKYRVLAGRRVYSVSRKAHFIGNMLWIPNVHPDSQKIRLLFKNLWHSKSVAHLILFTCQAVSLSMQLWSLLKYWINTLQEVVSVKWAYRWSGICGMETQQSPRSQIGMASPCELDSNSCDWRGLSQRYFAINIIEKNSCCIAVCERDESKKVNRKSHMNVNPQNKWCYTGSGTTNNQTNKSRWKKGAMLYAVIQQLKNTENAAWSVSSLQHKAN